MHCHSALINAQVMTFFFRQTAVANNNAYYFLFLHKCVKKAWGLPARIENYGVLIAYSENVFLVQNQEEKFYVCLL